MQTTVLPNQTMVDMALQSGGELDGLFELAQANGKGITDDLTPGTMVEMPTARSDRRRLAERLQVWGNRPASGFESADAPGGIGFMKIGNDFRVSG